MDLARRQLEMHLFQYPSAKMFRLVSEATAEQCFRQNMKTTVGFRSLATAATPRRSFPAHPPSYHQHSYHAHWRRHRPPVRKRPKRPAKTAYLSLSQLPSFLQLHPHRHYYDDWIRFWNPWNSLAAITTDDTLLSFKIESVTRTFGVVAALMCSLSAASLVVIPSASSDDDEYEIITAATADMSDINKTSDTNVSSTTTTMTTSHVSKSSLLVHWVGLSPKTTHDMYTASCAGAFYSSVCAMGLSAVINAWLAATPICCTRQFVQYHSWMICSIPGFLAVSTGLAGFAVFIGLDRAKGTPISYVGLGGTLLGGVMIVSATVRGMTATYRFLTPLVRAIK